MLPAPLCGNVGQVPCFCDTEAFLAYSEPDYVSNVSHLFVLGDFHCYFGWICFCYWAGRGEGSDDCNVLNHVQSSAGLQQACLRFETRFFVWREVVQAVFCHRCHSTSQTLKDRRMNFVRLKKSLSASCGVPQHCTMRGRGSNVSIGQQTSWNSIHDVQVFSMLFCFGFENGVGWTTAPKMGVEICHRTGAIGRDLPSLSFW